MSTDKPKPRKPKAKSAAPAKRKVAAKPAARAKAAAKKTVKRVVRADRKVTEQSMRFRDRPIMKLVASFLEAADQPPLIIASAGTLAIGLLAKRADIARGGGRMLASHLLATGAKLAVKHQFDRTRPSEAAKSGHRFEKGDEGGHEEKSFPSGHTAGAVAVARAAAHEIDGAAAPAAMASLAVAAGQAPTGNHYLTDVVAGAAIGWASEAVVGAVFDYFETDGKGESGGETAHDAPLPQAREG